jgi:hypothetical protein
VISFSGVPTSDGFAKSYELHYQPKKVEVDRATLFQQFGYMNFHAKRYRGSGAKLTIAMKNKWVADWTITWFYCKVPVHVCPQGGKSIHALHSHMSLLEFLTEPLINCPNSDKGGVAFVKSTGFIWGRDAIEEYLACGLYPLSASVSFGEVAEGVTLASKHKLSLPKFHVVCSDEEYDVKFLSDY